MLPGWEASYAVLISRWMFVGLIVLLASGLFERWPARLPRWLARWVLQVWAVAFVLPFAVLTAYLVTTRGDPTPLWQDRDRPSGLAEMTILGLLCAPWMAVSALLSQINGAARSQALVFELERSDLEHKALDARMRLLQAQVKPHFTVQHAGQRARTGGFGFAPGFGRAGQFDRLSSRRRAASA